MKTNHKSTIGRHLAVIGCVFILSAPICTAAAGNFRHLVENESPISSDIRRAGALDGTLLVRVGLIETNVTRLTDEQLNRIRGGLGRFNFGISFTGIFDKLGNLTGQIFSGNDSVPQELIESTISNLSSDETQAAGTNTNTVAEAANSSTTSQPAITNSTPDTVASGTTPQVTSIQTAEVDGAAISAYVGNFDGASGIFQISQSPGSYNVITNNMTINISIYNFASESQAATMLPSFLNAQ
jgi:hypothetical protein